MSQKQNMTPNLEVMSTILQNIPAEAEVTRIEYEGPRIALYTKRPEFLFLNSQIISDLVNTIKKRVVIRTDKFIRKTEAETKEMIMNILPKESEVTNIFFDDTLGELILEVKKPGPLNLRSGTSLIDLACKTGWKVKIRRTPPIASSSLQSIYHALKTAQESRERFFKETGERIFRSRLSSDVEVSLSTLGAFREVGRSALLIETKESKILLDCGINPGAKNPWDAYPRLDWANIYLDDLDCVIISHAHLDHSGFLPTLYKYGYDGPVYCTEPTLPLMTLLQMDYVKVASREGSKRLYDIRDVREVIRHCITLPYGLVTDISPDVKLVLNNAGHILGSSMVHLHIGEGAHNVVYSGDFKFGRTRLLESAVRDYPRVETLIIESTYGAKEDIMPARREVESSFVNTINETLSKKGKVLIPVPAVGRAQEIMLVIDEYMKQGKLIEAPVFIEGMISEATAIHVTCLEYLARDLRKKIFETDLNPFFTEYFTNIEHTNREEALQEGAAIIMATSGMLEGGPVLEYFGRLAPIEKNKILFVSYQIHGTLGRRILDGAKQVSIIGDNGKIKIVDINCQVVRVEGFSGHSDYNQIIKFVSKLRPKLQRVIVNHGERRKTENVANMINKIFKISAIQPSIQEAIKLY
ncbi:MAG: beta-CASP ribonuclease aCPSF1 [Candidatus Methylarchaceae archaeon HK02M1]|nr:beta-CASP ribonuclease aCPSF1 [Candidatus Methylarchaceae archaeon HK02M1]